MTREDDLISRQAVLDELNKWDWQELYLPIHFKENIIDVIPSFKPQEPKEGHWIEDDMTYCGVDLTNYKCDKCGEIGGAWRKGLKPDKLPKYCMNCGAKMESEDK